MDRRVTQFDIIIVGGGINGAGIARDAAMRGLKVLLLERDDFASGASGKNGRMIHGGLRYLEQAEIGLVREALVERKTLLRIAPHLVKRRDLIIPIRSGVGRPAWMVRLGLFALDLLSAQPSTFHRYLDRAETLRRIPSFNPSGLKGAAVMFDAFAEYAERLTLENVLDAVDHGATVYNHAPVSILLTAAGRVSGVVYRGADGQEQTAEAPIVINATGAWADEFLGQVAGQNANVLGPTKGTFIVVPRFDGAPEGSVFFEAREDRRPIIVTPWNGLYLVGTTDERISGPVDHAGASGQEIAYLLSELAHCFPSFSGRAQDVLYTYTGVRPLPRAGGVSTKVPRKHVIHDHAPAVRGLLTILGGKLSTFRSLAEEAVDQVFHMLGRRAPACRTAEVLLPGGRGLDALPAVQRRLTGLYGSRATNILALVEKDASLDRIIDDETGAIAAEIVFAAEQELAASFEDILVRRTMIGRNSQLGLNALDAVAGIAGSHLGWSAERVEANRKNYLGYVELSRAFAQSPRHLAPRAAAMGNA